jgi:hypothetical protein
MYLHITASDITETPSKSKLSIPWDALNLGNVPFLGAQGTRGFLVHPALDAVPMKHVSAISKCNRKTGVMGRRRISLILNAWLIKRIATNRTLQTSTYRKAQGQSPTVSENSPT